MSSRRETVDRDAFQEVMDRLARALGLVSNKQVAEALGLTASNVGERKSRGALPRRHIDALCDRVGLNPLWVYTGRGTQHAAARSPPLPGAVGPPEVPGSPSAPGSPAGPLSAREPHSPLADQIAVMRARGPYAPPVDNDLLTRTIAAVERALAERGGELDSAKRARLIASLYDFSCQFGVVSERHIGPLVDLALGR